VRRIRRLRCNADFGTLGPDFQPLSWIQDMLKPRLPSGRRAVVGNNAFRFLMPVLSVLSATLCGCAEVGRFSADDAERAASIAAAVGDAAGAACWPVIASTANAVAASGGQPGILAAIEENRAAKMMLANPACAPIWADVFADLLKIAAPALPVP
jgi:hypothetical protein